MEPIEVEPLVERSYAPRQNPGAPQQLHETAGKEVKDLVMV